MDFLEEHRAWRKKTCSYLQSAPLLVGQPVVGKKEGRGGEMERQTNKLLNSQLFIIPKCFVIAFHIIPTTHPNTGNSVEGSAALGAEPSPAASRRKPILRSPDKCLLFSVKYPKTEKHLSPRVSAHTPLSGRCRLRAF